eukprot:TRINITY_DN32108_c0_g1_i1.p1 TRINITY_DN32108_c0_g1~~TRINITY_DN32108_c0_g1_i1.p1  ORF type:complete len:263 (-),score=35.63 TRINITY_DN32108_c0_g1_i1:491-1225(-)
MASSYVEAPLCRELDFQIEEVVASPSTGARPWRSLSRCNLPASRLAVKGLAALVLFTCSFSIGRRLAHAGMAGDVLAAASFPRSVGCFSLGFGWLGGSSDDGLEDGTVQPLALAAESFKIFVYGPEHDAPDSAFRMIDGDNLTHVPSDGPHHGLSRGPYELNWKRTDGAVTVETSLGNHIWTLKIVANNDGSSGLAVATSCDDLDDQLKFPIRGVYTGEHCRKFGTLLVRPFNNGTVHIHFPTE